MSSRMVQMGGIGMVSQVGNNEFLFFSAADIIPPFQTCCCLMTRGNKSQSDRYIPFSLPGHDRRRISNVG